MFWNLSLQVNSVGFYQLSKIMVLPTVAALEVIILPACSWIRQLINTPLHLRSLPLALVARACMWSNIPKGCLLLRLFCGVACSAEAHARMHACPTKIPLTARPLFRLLDMSGPA